MFKRASHDTEASRRQAGVDPTIYWDFQPGQRVRVVEGFTGIVDRVEDGPHPGSEAYIVILDDGLGGGEYRSGELRPLSERTAATPWQRRQEQNRPQTCIVCGAPSVVEAIGSNTPYCAEHAEELGMEVESVWVDTPESNALFDLSSQIGGAGNQAMVWEGPGEPWRIGDGSPQALDEAVREADVTFSAAEGSNHMADQDYPELGTVLVDRPPLQHSVVGAKKQGGAVHKLEWLARGQKASGRCSCGVWAFLGNYIMPNRRVEAVKDEFAKHLAYVAEMEANPYTSIKTGAADTNVTDYGLRYDSSLAHLKDLNDSVDWDAILVTHVPTAGLWSTEEKLSSRPIDEVVSGGEAFRSGYDPRVVIDSTGRRVVVDGNHRAAMHLGLGHDHMPAKVFDLRENKISSVEGGIMDRILDPWARDTIRKLDPEFRPGAQGPGSRWSYDWCFSADTEFLTYDGLRAFKDVAGTSQLVLDGRGIWVEADVRSFGVAALRKITLKKGRGTKVIYATGNHRWLLRGVKDQVITDDLTPGDGLVERLPRSYLHHWRPSPFGIAHGVVYGDGTLVSEKVLGTFRPGPARVNLWGEKYAQLLRYFVGHRIVPVKGGANQKETVGVQVTGLPRHFKQRPSLESDPAYLYGWLSGYFAADGRVGGNGSNIELSSANRTDLEFVQAVCARLTIATHDIRQVNRTGCAGKGCIHDYRMDTKGECSLCEVSRVLYSLALVPQTLREEFFLIEDHRRRFLARKEIGEHGKLGVWCVASVEETDRVEEVFCAVVASTESFVLQDNILTSNCRFRKNRRCMYAKELDVQGTQEAGYAVWVPEDRGLCPRDKWEQQKACPVGEPGPHSKERDARPDATVPWNQGGQRGYVAVNLTTKKEANYYYQGSDTPLSKKDIIDLMIEHGVVTSEKAQEMLRNKYKVQKLVEMAKPLLNDLWGAHILTIRTDQMYDPGPRPEPDQEMIDWMKSRIRPTSSFEFFAAWDDIREKAKRIRETNGVRILAVDSRHIAGQVKGDDSTYDTVLEFAPGTKELALWDCTCPWSKYAWGRTRQWKKFEGRQCAHALALGWEAQSRGMFGREIIEDTAKIARAHPMGKNLNVEQTVDWMMEISRQVESRVTPLMQKIAARADGLLEGLQFKFKQRDSLLRKFKLKLDQGKSLDDPFAVVQDALRYTMVFSTLAFSADVQNAIYALEEAGFRPPEPKNWSNAGENSWARGDSYSSLHYNLEDPSKTLLIELQFHTTKSLQVKEQKAHKLFEEFRDQKTPLKRRQQLWDLLKGVYDLLPTPPDVMGWGKPKWYPRPASLHPDLRPAPAVAVARSMLSEGQAFPLVAEYMTSLGAPDGLAIVTEALLSHPFPAKVPGKGEKKVVDVERGEAVLIDGTTVPASQVIYPTFHPTKGLSLVGLKADANSTGVMVALRPPDVVCEALAQEGGESVEEMHITLCYLGNTDEIDRDDAEAATLAFAEQAGILSGRLAGFGQFLNGGEEPAVLIALWDVPGLDRFRLALKDSLAGVGVKRAENHGFTPHTTIAYGEEPFEELPEVPDEVAGNVAFESVILAYGGEWMEFPLRGPATVKGSDEVPLPKAASLGVNSTLQTLAAKCPRCDHLAGWGAKCQDCGYKGEKVGSVSIDADGGDQMRWTGTQSEIHEPEEPALPTTTAEDDEVPKPGDPKLSWLMSGSSRTASAAATDTQDIAAAAKSFLQKEALKVFTPSEQQTIIEEGIGVEAANLDALDIIGTHYADLQEAMDEAEDEGVGLWL